MAWSLFGGWEKGGPRQFPGRTGAAATGKPHDGKTPAAGLRPRTGAAAPVGHSHESRN